MAEESKPAAAARLYAALVTRTRGVPEDGIQSLLEGHENLRAELEGVHEIWLRLRDQLGATGAAAALARRAPTPPESQAQLRSEVLDRLITRPAPIDRYSDEREVARGGMGAILEVRDEDLGRRLAMKVISGREPSATPSTPSIEPRTLARFLEEAQVTAQLDHPGIVPVHELGVDAGGRVFFTMKLVKGRDLSVIFDLVQRQREGWSQTRALGVLVRVCEAMSYAHAKGVIHRDLKPANVMVGKFGEVYVMDWGLARVLGKPNSVDVRPRLEPLASAEIRPPRRRMEERPDASHEQQLMTLEGDVIGTPVYMSPEQAQGRLEEMGPHSDVYSLGAMLYHLLTGVMPYCKPEASPDHFTVLEQVQSRPPEPISTLAPSVSPELVAICEKAMARDTLQRYPDMEALRSDLSAYLEGRVVRAYESGALAELRKWIRRNRLLSFASAAAVLALVIGLVVSLVLGAEARKQRANVLNLSAFTTLDLLRSRADELWPVSPALIPAYEQWLLEARALVGGATGTIAGPDVDVPSSESGVSAHVTQLQALRAKGRRLTPEELEAAIARSPVFERLRSLEEELATLVRASEVRRGATPPSLPRIDPELEDVTPRVLNELAWPLVMSDRTEFGRESEGLALALRALSKSGPEDDRAEIEDTLAWAYFAHGRDAEAIESAKRAITNADPAEREAYEAGLILIQAAVDEAAGAASDERRAALEADIDQVRSQIEGQVAWRFEDEESRWWHARLSALVQELRRLADPRSGLIDGVDPEQGWGIAKRLAEAKRIQRLTVAEGSATEAWNRARDDIRSSPAYRGLDLVPQVGLLPLGRDQVSGLYEFAHVASGDLPSRADDGRLRIDETTCIILVLIPGDAFLMGAQSVDPDGPNFDPLAESDESVDALLGTLQTETIAPYFLSKYELNQAQWERATDKRPSSYHVGRSGGGLPITGLHPVENISWNDAVVVLSRLDLVLPTEAQWEHAARGGRETPWYTGRERETLMGQVNLADRTAAQANFQWRSIDDWPELEDGFAVHAPVGSLPPNPYGLHEVLGNVQEWCLDSYARYMFPSRPGTAERVINGATQRASRGGGFNGTAHQSRVTYRLPYRADFSFQSLGVRPARALRLAG